MSPTPDTATRRTGTSSRGRTHMPTGRSRRDGGMVGWLPMAVLLVFALLFGGSANPIGDMAIDCLAVVVLAIQAIVFTPEDWSRSRLGWAVAAVTAAVAAIELLPIPYSIWRALPGRQQAAAELDLLGLASGYRALSLDPNATVATLIQFVPGLAAFIATLAASRHTRQIWTSILIVGGIACVVLGSLQIAGQTQFYFYAKSNFGEVTGLFANHNHAADFMLIGIALLAGRLIARDRTSPGGPVLLIALAVALAVAIVLTASRFGIVLLLGEALCVMLFLRRNSTRVGWLPIVAAALACVAFGAVLMLNANVVHALDRFNDFSAELRGEIWARTVEASLGYWPIGSGLGTFVPVYTGVEHLDTMPSQVVNHAHNEYLELFLELGIVGALAIIAYLVGFGAKLLRLLGRSGDPEVLGASLGIIVLLLSSLVEFPLRNESLMVTFGILNGIVFGAAQRKPDQQRRRAVS